MSGGRLCACVREWVRVGVRERVCVFVCVGKCWIIDVMEIFYRPSIIFSFIVSSSSFRSPVTTLGDQ